MTSVGVVAGYQRRHHDDRGAARRCDVSDNQKTSAASATAGAMGSSIVGSGNGSRMLMIFSLAAQGQNLGCVAVDELRFRVDLARHVAISTGPLKGKDGEVGAEAEAAEVEGWISRQLRQLKPIDVTKLSKRNRAGGKAGQEPQSWRCAASDPGNGANAVAPASATTDVNTVAGLIKTTTTLGLPPARRLTTISSPSIRPQMPPADRGVGAAFPRSLAQCSGGDRGGDNNADTLGKHDNDGRKGSWGRQRAHRSAGNIDAPSSTHNVGAGWSGDGHDPSRRFSAYRPLAASPQGRPLSSNTRWVSGGRSGGCAGRGGESASLTDELSRAAFVIDKDEELPSRPGKHHPLTHQRKHQSPQQDQQFASVGRGFMTGTDRLRLDMRSKGARGSDSGNGGNCGGSSGRGGYGGARERGGLGGGRAGRGGWTQRRSKEEDDDEKDRRAHALYNFSGPAGNKRARSSRGGEGGRGYGGGGARQGSSASMSSVVRAVPRPGDRGGRGGGCAGEGGDGRRPLFKPRRKGGKAEEEERGGGGDEDVHPLLRNVDPTMVEMIENEIVQSGDSVGWNDIAGLAFAKRTITETVITPMQRPDLFSGLRSPPKGILLYGPPGTGKTLIGKAVASQCDATFFSISASSLTSKWTGDAEKMVRALFAVARVRQPTVIFVDEIDSMLTQRSEGDAEVSRRMKTEFLVQIDGCGTNAHDRILVIGATNRPQELDEAVRRRMVKRLYIPLPSAEARRSLISNLLGKHDHAMSDDDLAHVVTKTKGYSGADIHSLCCEAAMGPLRTAMDAGTVNCIGTDELRPIAAADFDAALINVKSSVSQSELQQYVDWSAQFGTYPAEENAD